MTRTMLVAAAVAVSLLVPRTAALAQDEGPDRRVVSERINEAAKGLSERLTGLATQLDELPQEMEAAEAIFDEMLASVDAVLAMVDPDQPLAQDVMALKLEAEKRRDYWLQRCEEEQDNRDCEFMRIWDGRMQEALEEDRNFLGLVDRMQRQRDSIAEERIYIIESYRLEMFDAGLESLRSAISAMQGVSDDMAVLAGEIGRDDLGQQETD